MAEAPENESPDLKLEDLKKEVERLTRQNLLLQADFDNAKKRWLKNQMEVQETANWEVIEQLLEIFDDFQRALAGSEPSKDQAHFRTGVEMIGKRIEEFLKSMGVTPIEAVGKPFDPLLHDAVAHEATDQVAESTVLSELRKGYVMNGRVLRPAMVKVAVAASNSSANSGG